MTYRDILTVMWKERKGLLRVRGRRSQFIFLMFTPIFLAVFFPVQMGLDWLDSAFSLIVAMVVPMLIVGTSIPDSFAGERERATLPTLLASRLSERSILVGKTATSVLFGWGMTLVFLLLSLIAVNVTIWDGAVHLYQPSLIVADLVLSFLMALLTAGAGVLFSLRSATVQEAQQSLMAVLLIPPMLLQAVLFLVLGSESSKARLREVLGAYSFEQIALLIAGVLALLAGVLLFGATRRFQRPRLILD